MFVIEALLLAAGESKRFGEPKQLTLIDGSPMIIRVLRAFEQAEFKSTTVVLGGHLSKVSDMMRAHNIECKTKQSSEIASACEISKQNSQKAVPSYTLIAKLWHQGMGASIAQGIQSLEKNTTHVLVGLADQVDVGTTQCNLLIDASRTNPSKIIAAYYNGKLGAPAIFPRHYFSELASLSDDKGARDIIRANKQQTIAIDMPEAARDIDTKQDLRAYELNNKKF